MASARKYSNNNHGDRFDFLYRLNIHVTDHEEHVLMRRFDHNSDGRISMEEFYNTLAQEF